MKPIAGNLGHIRQAIMRGPQRAPVIFSLPTHIILAGLLVIHKKITVADLPNKDCDCFTMQIAGCS